MSTGLALSFTAVNTFKVISKAIPSPAKDEIVIKVRAAGIAPVDGGLYRGFMPHQPFFKEFPTVLGYEAAGEVHAVGAEVKNFSVGDRVVKSASMGDREGAFQQYCTAKAALSSRIPDSISFDQAATFPLNFETASNGMYAGTIMGTRTGAGLVAPWLDGGRGKYAGQPILITNGPSSVGQFAIQLAKLSGFSPIITTSSQKHNKLLESLGADVVIDRNLSWDEIVEQSRAAAKNTPFNFIWDIVSDRESELACYDLIKPGGHLTVSRRIEIKPEENKKDVVIHETWGQFCIPSLHEYAIKGYATLHEYFVNGDVKPAPVKLISGGLNGVLTALDYIKEGKVSGEKLIIRPFETA